MRSLCGQRLQGQLYCPPSSSTQTQLPCSPVVMVAVQLPTEILTNWKSQCLDILHPCFLHIKRIHFRNGFQDSFFLPLRFVFQVTEFDGDETDDLTEASTLLQPAETRTQVAAADAPNARLTEALAQRVMALEAENSALRLAAASSSSAPATTATPIASSPATAAGSHRGPADEKFIPRPWVQWEVLERSRKDVRNLKDARRKQRKAANT